MKRFIFYIFSFASLTVFAQDAKVYLGINTAGVWNSYLFRHDDNYVLQGRPNWSIGFQSKYVISKSIHLDAQLNLASKNFGSSIDYSYYSSVDPNDPSLNSRSSQWAVRQNYLEVPISVSYFFQTDKPIKFFCSTGFTNSFSLSAKYAGSHALLSSNADQVAERYRSILLSLRAGGGMLFLMGNEIYGMVECYSNVYLGRAGQYVKGNPFQLALGFSVMKKIGRATATAN